ncbi:MAG: GNAT family N-acetyltransferase [Pseudomonadota bacterium]
MSEVAIQYSADEAFDQKSLWNSGSTTFNVFEYEGQECELISCQSIESIQSIKDDWLRLEANSGEVFTYFQTYDWCFNWCSKFTEKTDTGPQIQVFLLKVNGQTALIWPMMQEKTSGDILVLRSLTESLGQYCNWLYDCDVVTSDLAWQVWQNIHALCDADAITLTNVAETSLLATTVDGLGFKERIPQVSSILEYDGIDTWDSYYKSLSRSQRKERLRRARKLEEQGDVSYEVYEAGSSEFKQYVEAAIVMKQQWLQETERQSLALFDSRTIDFLKSLSVENCSKDGKAFVHVLSLDNQPIALEIGMVLNRHYYSYLGSIDLEWKSFSPGKIQIDRAQKWAFDQGVQCFDFLSDPSDYKKSWSNKQFAMVSVSIPVTFRGRLYCSLWKSLLRPTLKDIYLKSGNRGREFMNLMTRFKENQVEIKSD